jgi:pimeloyl-ACP methyl ester carboxylesterase
MPQTEEAVFYQLYFQEPGVAEADLERDVRLFIRGNLYANSGNNPRREPGAVPAEAVGMVPRASGLLPFYRSERAAPKRLPPWITEADVDFYTGEFTRTGFRGGLNYYRNIDRNWELLAPFADAKVTVPALYITGDRDLVMSFRGMDELIRNLGQLVPQLRQTVVLPGCGHWTQQERPAEVNAAMLEFLRAL